MVGRNNFELFLSNLEFGTEKNRDPGIEIDVSYLPPPPPTRKKSLGRRQMLCGFTDIFALLSS